MIGLRLDVRFVVNLRTMVIFMRIRLYKLYNNYIFLRIVNTRDEPEGNKNNVNKILIYRWVNVQETIRI